jgi:FkbM family methyltransferase
MGRLHRCWLGYFEYDKQRLISSMVRPGGVFYDIGANVGFYTLLASKLIGSGQVVAFEPAPRNLFYLKRHLELNRVGNVEAMELAVSDKDGTANFEVEETGFMGHLSGGEGITVSTASLDSLIEQGKLPAPNCIKMDIEGAEFQALRGARRTFERHHPILFLATHGREVHANCVQLLRKWGYSCKSLDDGDLGESGELIAQFES